MGLLALSGCHTSGACPKLPITQPGMLLSSRHYDRSAITSLRAEAKVDQRGQGGRIKGRVLMFVQRPESVRFDVMTQFGPALIFTSDGQDFSLSDFKENRYLSGPACERNIARLIGVALSGEAVANVLLGDVPDIQAQNEEMVCEKGSYLLSRGAADGSRQELRFGVRKEDADKPPEAQRTDLTSLTYYSPAGAKLYHVRYEDYRAVGNQGARLPFTVRIEDTESDSDAVLRFQSIDVNVKVPEGAFEQTPRAGLAVEQVGCD